uniref:Uncharacterized protein n=1 Tax=Callorhinchus milii TaxID=7868 RepID=A0A4W3HI51_CALMI
SLQVILKVVVESKTVQLSSLSGKNTQPDSKSRTSQISDKWCEKNLSLQQTVSGHCGTILERSKKVPHGKNGLSLSFVTNSQTCNHGN